MTQHTDEIISWMRDFNRYYTNVLGLLDQHILGSSYSLSEARVLHEIGRTQPCTAAALAGTLHIDAGYLSRMLKRFESARAAQPRALGGRRPLLQPAPDPRRRSGAGRAQQGQ